MQSNNFRLLDIFAKKKKKEERFKRLKTSFKELQTLALHLVTQFSAI